MDPFVEFLDSNRSKKFMTVTPGGNHGDTLIHMGMIKKLREKNISYSSLNLEKEYKKNIGLGIKYLINIGLWKIGSSRGFGLLNIPKDTDMIMFEGGGYMNHIWYGPVLFHQIASRTDLPVVVAPQSYLFKKANLEKIFGVNDNITLFCRESYSQKHLKDLSISKNVDIKLSHDTALYLKKKDLEEYFEPIEEDYELISFRKDRESVVSKEIKKKVINRCENPLVKDVSTLKKFEDFISLVENAREVYTDRLHVAILSKIFSKKCRLYPNRYHKNFGVWEYSLKPHVRYENLSIREF
ncbi:hypothetical protein GF319_15230 [Candidatus Bathyarchaeota archaeon]|nr:hypothetical protein [Candidatus Bathyarchaeota archaeon]